MLEDGIVTQCSGRDSAKWFHEYSWAIPREGVAYDDYPLECRHWDWPMEELRIRIHMCALVLEGAILVQNQLINEYNKRMDNGDEKVPPLQGNGEGEGPS
jgi:hypothetical protein